MPSSTSLLGHSPGTSWELLVWGVSPPHPVLGAQVTAPPHAAFVVGGLASFAFVFVVWNIKLTEMKTELTYPSEAA